MSAWLMSIVGVVSLSVLLEILLSDGETSKFIKGVFSLAIVLVIVLPLPKLLKGDLDFGKIFDSPKYEYDQSFIANNAKDRNKNREISSEKLINELGISDVEVKIYIKDNDYNNIEIVNVYMNEKDKQSQIKSELAKYLGVKEEVIRVYDR